jgi:hypothetical protein
MDERRKFPRFESTFQIKYCCEGKADKCGYTLADNISKGGLRMPALSKIAGNGDVINLELKTNDGKGYVSTAGKIRWTKTIRRAAPLDEEAGIEFSKALKININKLIK